MALDPDKIYFGEDFIHDGSYRGLQVPDFRRHVYTSGKTGSGKSSLLLSLLVQLSNKGHGVGLLDPHGTLSEDWLDRIPPNRINDVAFFNPSDRGRPVGFNPLRQVPRDDQYLVVDAFVDVCRSKWAGSWGVRLERILKATVAALLETPDANILGIRRMLTDYPFRKHILEHVIDPETRAFWTGSEFSSYEKSRGGEALTPVLNKIADFVSSPTIRNIIGQSVSTIDLRQVMDQGQIFIADLSKGKIGIEQSNLLGAFLVSSFAQAAFSRVDMKEDDRRDFVLVIDEFQNFSTESFINILSEARKFRLCLVIAHQYQKQLDEGVMDAVVGNVGSLVAFQQGVGDADLVAKAFDNEIRPERLTDLDPFQTYTRLVRGNLTGSAHKMKMIPPSMLPAYGYKNEIIRQSRRRYGCDRKFVEKRVANRIAPLQTKNSRRKTT